MSKVFGAKEHKPSAVRGGIIAAIDVGPPYIDLLELKKRLFAKLEKMRQAEC